MITFIVNNDDKKINIECPLNDSILNLKKEIIKKFNLNCNYVDIDFILERPIRSLGKFNLESGIIPRSLDKYTFDRYGLDDKEINCKFIEINDYDEKKYNRKFVHKSLIKREKNFYEEGKSFNIESMDDFPSLGS